MLLDRFLGEDLRLGEGELFFLGDTDRLGDLDLLPESARFLGESDSALRDLRLSAPLVSSPLWLSAMSDFVGDCEGLCTFGVVSPFSGLILGVVFSGSGSLRGVLDRERCLSFLFFFFFFFSFLCFTGSGEVDFFLYFLSCLGEVFSSSSFSDSAFSSSFSFLLSFLPLSFLLLICFMVR